MSAPRTSDPRKNDFWDWTNRPAERANTSTKKYMSDIDWRNMASLVDLPSELVPLILDHLGDEDLFATRLANKYLESSSLSYFGRRYFRKKGYLITSPSLNVLKSVANHGELRKHVQHVWFNPDLYTFVTPECAPDPHWPYAEIYHTRSEDDARKYDIYQDCIHDHKNLLHTSKLKEMLGHAFSNLPNLEAVGMRRSEDHQPWGWSRLKTAIGEDPRILGSIPTGPMSSLSGPTYLFLSIVNALATTDVKLKRFYTDAIEIDNIRLDILPQTTLDAALHSLLYLELNASKAWLTQKSKLSTSLEESEYGDGLVRLFKAAPQLEELGLQIFRDLRQSYMVPPASRNPESWKYSYPHLTFQKLVNNVSLSRLTRLKLEKIITTPDILESFMMPSRRYLRSIKFRDIRLLSSEDMKTPWHPVLRFLRDQCDNLSYILFYHLMYEGGGVSFVEQPPAMVNYFDTEDTNGAPNPPYGEPSGGELFTKYDHIAIEASGVEAVKAKLDIIADRHWYQQPIFSYSMDESLWHTDTSDEEW